MQTPTLHPDTLQRANQIADQIRIARQRKRMTQAEVAALLKCSRKRINEIERGMTYLNVVEADILAQALGVQPEFFFRRDI